MKTKCECPTCKESYDKGCSKTNTTLMERSGELLFLCKWCTLTTDNKVESPEDSKNATAKSNSDEKVH